jgi:hypothetical protein
MSLLRDGAVPRPIVRAVLRARARLLRMADAVVPPQAALLDQVAGIGRTVALHVVAKHRIADRIAGGRRTKAELALDTGLRPELLERVLSSLVAAGIFEIDRKGRYANNRMSNVLREGSEGSLRAMAEYFGDKLNVLPWAEVGDTMATGASPFETIYGSTIWDYFAKQPDKSRLFAQAMAELTAIDAPTLAGGYDFSRFARICDVAGGRGILLSAILARYPTPRGVLFDEAHVLAESEELLRARGLSERVECVAGSFFERVPEGCDAYVLKDILHDWDDDRCVRILENVRRAMKPDARVLVCELPIDHGRPEYPAPISDLQMLVVCAGGRQRSLGDFRTLFARADLRLSAAHDLSLPMSIFEGAPA